MGRRKSSVGVRHEVVVADPEQLGAVIATARIELGLDRDALAEWVDTNGSYIGRLERGEAVRQLVRVFTTLDALGLELVVRPRGLR